MYLYASMAAQIYNKQPVNHETQLLLLHANKAVCSYYLVLYDNKIVRLLLLCGNRAK